MKEWLLQRLNSMGAFALDKLIPAVIVAAIGLLLTQLVLRFVSLTLKRTKLEKAGHKLVRSIIRAVLYILLGLSIASSLGIDVTGIVALASVLTLAVSLAVQNALTNLFGGISLLYSKPFTMGDFVEVAGQSGTVQEIGLTYTKLTTGDNKLISIPNSAVVSAEIVNYTTTGKRRLEVKISASYDNDMDAVMAALLETTKGLPLLEEPAPFVGVDDYGDHAITYVLRAWSETGLYWDNLFAIRKNVKKLFDEKGIAMTYPHLNVHLDK